MAAKAGRQGIEALTGLPGWPLMLSAPQAAAYVGLDLDDFERAVDAGELPKPAVLEKHRRWNRQKIDRHLDDPASPAVGSTDAVADALSRWNPK